MRYGQVSHFSVIDLTVGFPQEAVAVFRHLGHKSLLLCLILVAVKVAVEESQGRLHCRMTVDRVAPSERFFEMGFRYTDSVFFVQRLLSHCPLFASDQLDLPWLQLLHNRSVIRQHFLLSSLLLRLRGLHEQVELHIHLGERVLCHFFGRLPQAFVERVAAQVIA